MDTATEHDRMYSKVYSQVQELLIDKMINDGKIRIIILLLILIGLMKLLRRTERKQTGVGTGLHHFILMSRHQVLPDKMSSMPMTSGT